MKFITATDDSAPLHPPSLGAARMALFPFLTSTMKASTLTFFFCLSLSVSAVSQQTAAQPGPQERQTPKTTEIVVVTGTPEPVPLSESDRDVASIKLDQPALYPAALDLLRVDPSVDLRERGANGVQADVSILGSTFGQTLVLVDGMRV